MYLRLKPMLVQHFRQHEIEKYALHMSETKFTPKISRELEMLCAVISRGISI